MATDMRDRIRKLLERAENVENLGTPEGVAEAKACRERALELAAKWEIDVAEAIARGEKIEVVTSVFINVTRPFIQRMQLLTAIAKYCSCDVIRITGYKNRVHVFGFESDMSTFRMIFASVCVQAEREFAATPVPAGSVLRTFRRAWWQGFAAGVWSQTQQVRKQADSEASPTPGAEIVLRDKTLKVTEEVGKAYPELGKARRTSVRYFAGQQQGFEAGRRATLEGTSLGSAEPKGSIE